MADVSAKVEVPFVDLPEMDGFALLLKRDAGGSQYVGSADHPLFEM